MFCEAVVRQFKYNTDYYCGYELENDRFECNSY